VHEPLHDTSNKNYNINTTDCNSSVDRYVKKIKEFKEAVYEDKAAL